MRGYSLPSPETSQRSRVEVSANLLDSGIFEHEADAAIRVPLLHNYSRTITAKRGAELRVQFSERERGVASSRQDQPWLDVFLTRAGSSLRRSGGNEHHGTQLGTIIIRCYFDRRREKVAERVACFVTTPGRRAPDVSRHSLGDDIDPLAAGVIVAAAGKFQLPQGCIDAYDVLTNLLHTMCDLLVIDKPSPTSV